MNAQAMKDAMGDAMLINVRRAAVFEKASTQIRAATWRDPAEGMAVQARGLGAGAARSWGEALGVGVGRGHQS
jgi:hypothetical protein